MFVPRLGGFSPSWWCCCYCLWRNGGGTCGLFSACLYCDPRRTESHNNKARTDRSSGRRSPCRSLMFWFAISSLPTILCSPYHDLFHLLLLFYCLLPFLLHGPSMSCHLLQVIGISSITPENAQIFRPISLCSVWPFPPWVQWNRLFIVLNWLPRSQTEPRAPLVNWITCAIIIAIKIIVHIHRSLQAETHWRSNLISIPHLLLLLLTTVPFKWQLLRFYGFVEQREEKAQDCMNGESV